MSRVASLFLVVLASSYEYVTPHEYIIAPAAKTSCRQACETAGMVCNNEARLALELDEAKKLFAEKGVKCDVHKRNHNGPYHQIQRGTNKRECTSATEEARTDARFTCDYTFGSSRTSVMCVCDAAPTCVNVEEEHELVADADGFVPELNRCTNVASGCECMADCQQDEGHLSFAWNEGKDPNCCCYVDV